jgi:hypothetical protein
MTGWSSTARTRSGTRWLECRGRAGADRPRELVGEIADERSLEVVEFLAPGGALDVQDTDHAVGYPKGDGER